MNYKNKINNIDCQEAVKRFNTFIDNYLKGKAKEELLQHIDSCRHCFERLEFEQLLKRKINKVSKVSTVNEIKAKNNIARVLTKLLAENT
jgi:anti-sigma factor (TIGR02949 family)